MQGFFCDRARIRTWDLLIRSELLYPAELRNQYLFPSGWQDSNLRPPAPKAGAITGLRYTPKKSGETGTRTLATVARRQISNLLHYRSGTSPISICYNKELIFFAIANVHFHIIYHNIFLAFFYYLF
jgi:hypothetical protein